MLIQGYSDFLLKTPVFRPGASEWIALCKLDADVSQLFPYINAVAEDALYYEQPHYIQFNLAGRLCSLYADRVTIKSFEDREQAQEFINRLIDFLNDLFSKKDSLTPNHKKYKHQSVIDIFKILPRTNCQECGFVTCMAFAAALSKGKTLPEQCPHLTKPIRETAAYPVYDEDGHIVSAVEIEIGTAKKNRELKTAENNFEASEKEVVASTRSEHKTPFKSEHDGIQVNLTGREVEVLRLMAEGFTNTEISELLFISHHTVKSHVVHIFNKLGVNDRTQAAVWAARNDLV